MKYKKLIDVSRTFLEMHPPFAAPVFSSKVFDTGAKWMFGKLQEIENKPDMKFNSSINFYAYGLLKYSISISAFLFSMFVFFKINLFLLPLSVLIFYLVEVHFLFLFPVLIDNIKSPICTSIKLTYKTGIFMILVNIMILETLEFIKMTQIELSKRLGKTPSKVNDIITGKEPITVSTALQLEKVLGIDAKFWLNREMEYREKLTRIEQEEALEECKDWLKQQPIKQLQECGYIKSSKQDASMILEFLQFYAVDTPIQWESVYIENYAKTSFRKSSIYASALASMAAWLRIGEIAIKNLQLPDFNKDIFKIVLERILQLVQEHPEDFAPQLQSLCFEAGVAVVYTVNLPKAPISGAARWIGGQPLIQMTDRYKTNDQFWFTFFHEVGHILLHGKKELFIEDFEGYELNNDKEQEANKFASDWLLPDSFINNLPAGTISESDVRRIARTYHTHPAIVLGRLQKLRKVPYHLGVDMKMKVVLSNYLFKLKG